jgi:hypothetical protein
MWHPDDPVSIFPVWISRIQSYHHGISRNPGKLLNSLSMLHPVCNLSRFSGRRFQSDYSLIINGWSLYMLQLTTVNSIMTSLPKWQKSNINQSGKEKSESELPQVSSVCWDSVSQMQLAYTWRVWIVASIECISSRIVGSSGGYVFSF